MSFDAVVPTCYRHPDRQTRLGCSACGRPVCVECVQRAAVGQLCPQCVAERGRQQVVGAEALRSPQAARTPVAMGILVVCAVIFAAGLVSTEARNVTLTYGAQFNPAVAAGQWYRLLTAAFLHADLMHILFNLWALYVFGPQIERQVGSAAFLGLYVGSAVAGGAAFYLLAPSGVAVGASGAIFGLFGAWLAAAYRHRHTRVGRAGFQQLLTLLAINLALPLFIPRIAWQAHAGGLLAGIVITWLWTLPGVRARGPLRVLAPALVTAVALVLVLAV